VINPRQFETGQCCVITRRHVATVLELSDEECAAALVSARRDAVALLAAYRPQGILTCQNNGIFSGQETRISISMSCRGKRAATGGSARRSSRRWTARGAPEEVRTTRLETQNAWRASARQTRSSLQP
jgi:hypothetical protein